MRDRHLPLYGESIFSTIMRNARPTLLRAIKPMSKQCAPTTAVIVNQRMATGTECFVLRRTQSLCRTANLPQCNMMHHLLHYASSHQQVR